MSNHDRSNHDRRIMSEKSGVYIAMKSAVTLTETETFTVLCREGDSWQWFMLLVRASGWQKGDSLKCYTSPLLNPWLEMCDTLD